MTDTPDPIQEAVAHFRDDADFNRSWIDGRRGAPRSAIYIERRAEVAAQRDRWADAIEARERETGRLREALRKFAIRMEYDYPGDTPEPCGLWCDLCRQHVSDDGTSGHDSNCLLNCINPSEVTGSADRDAAGTTTRCRRCNGSGQLRVAEPECNGGDISAPCEAIKRCAELLGIPWEDVPDAR